MRKCTQLVTAAAAALGLAAGSASAQQTDAPNENPAEQPADNPSVDRTERVETDQAKTETLDRLHRVESLIDAKIQNPQGEDLGEIEEMVLDVNTGDIRYAVVSYGGIGDLGDKLFAVPLKAMTFRLDNGKEPFFVVDIDRQRLENASGFDEDNWPNFADASFAAAANKTYGLDAPPQASADKGALYKLSTFEGVNVRGKDNKELGEIEWILVDPMQAKVSHLALDLEDDVDNLDERGDEPNDATETEVEDDSLVLVPMAQFELKTQSDDTFLMVDVDLEKIRTAPTVTEEQFEDATKHKALREKVDSHFGAK